MKPDMTLVDTPRSDTLSKWRLLGVWTSQMSRLKLGMSRTEACLCVLGAGVTFGVILPYSRQHEYEADQLGAGFMVGADYRANEAVRFWDNMTQASGNKPMEITSTHPSDQSRISAMASYISTQGYA